MRDDLMRIFQDKAIGFILFYFYKGLFPSLPLSTLSKRGEFMNNKH